MNVEIDRVAITLHGVSEALGGGVAKQLGNALQRRLSELKLRNAGSGVGQLDLGVIDAPSHGDANTITELIASRLVDWIVHEHGTAATTTDGAATDAPATGATAGADGEAL